MILLKKLKILYSEHFREKIQSLKDLEVVK